MTVKSIKEHEDITELSSYDEHLKEGLCLNPQASEYNRRYFLQWNLSKSTYRYSASYVIGVQWVKTVSKGTFALAVLPKIEKIDFLKMFMECFLNPEEDESFHKIYGINFEAEPIECDSLDSVLSPLLIVQYISRVQRLLHNELKKSYIDKSDNLNKVKGKIVVNRNFKVNEIRGIQHRIYCNYQEYTCNTIENRIIKKALIFSKHIIQKLKSPVSHELLTSINTCLSKMIEVSDDVSIVELKSVKYNAIYKGYKETLILAKYILKRYDYNLSNTLCNKTKIPPFWIDMPLLFEHYIGGKLSKAYPNDIIYQAKGKTGFPDFLSKSAHAILDTKYKPQLEDGKPEVDIIRQLAGYSRDCKILNLLGVDTETVVPCAFIYPDENIKVNDSNVFSVPLTEILSPKSKYAIDGLTSFYCINIGIPKLE